MSKGDEAAIQCHSWLFLLNIDLKILFDIPCKLQGRHPIRKSDSGSKKMMEISSVT